MKSMTGFGYSEYTDQESQIIISLKSYNNKYLDIVTYIPQPFIQLEPKVREFLNERVYRGRVEFSLTLRELSEATDFILDKGLAEKAMKTLKELVDLTGLEDTIHLSHLLRIEGLLKPYKTRDIDQLWEKIRPVLEKVFTDFERSRMLEGEKTKEDIVRQAEFLKEAVAFIEDKASLLEDYFKKTIRDRFVEILGDLVDESRILSETAVLLVKYSINEEIVRLKSHLEQMSSTISNPEPKGKALDFLCQELGREINTLGSKSSLLEISQKVILMKEALERIREQVRNVE